MSVSLGPSEHTFRFFNIVLIVVLGVSSQGWSLWESELIGESRLLVLTSTLPNPQNIDLAMVEGSVAASYLDAETIKDEFPWRRRIEVTYPVPDRGLFRDEKVRVWKSELIRALTWLDEERVSVPRPNGGRITGFPQSVAVVQSGSGVKVQLIVAFLDLVSKEMRYDKRVADRFDLNKVKKPFPLVTPKDPFAQRYLLGSIQDDIAARPIVVVKRMDVKIFNPRALVVERKMLMSESETSANLYLVPPFSLRQSVSAAEFRQLSALAEQGSELPEFVPWIHRRISFSHDDVTTAKSPQDLLYARLQYIQRELEAQERPHPFAPICAYYVAREAEPAATP